MHVREAIDLLMIKNAKTLPKVYFGLHMLPGCAEYREPEREPYRIFLNESTIKKMDVTFQGRPVYVQHVDEVNLDKLQSEADGYVIRSFYNAADGKHWAEFIVVSDRGHEAISTGWRLSNAYIPKEFAGGGLWNGIEYSKEVTAGEYEHLAIVPNPRYDESIILTPEKFKEYNEKKELELKRLANSQGEEKVGLNIFKRAKLENALDIEQTMVTLPNSKVDKSIAEVVAIADKVMNMHGYAAPEHMVKLQEGEMSVGELSEAYNKKCNDEKMRMEEEEKKKNKESVEDPGEKKAEKDDDKKVDKTKNEDVGDKKEVPGEEKKSNHFEALQNANKTGEFADPVKVDLDKLARGKSRYGSN